jgi:hypothetical protein
MVFRFLVKENSTHCCFKLYEYNEKSLMPIKLLTIKEFEDPFYNTTYFYDREKTKN